MEAVVHPLVVPERLRVRVLEILLRARFRPRSRPRTLGGASARSSMDRAFDYGSKG